MSDETSQTTRGYRDGWQDCKNAILERVRASVELLVEKGRAEERARCVAIIRKYEMDWDDAIDEIENG